MKKFVIIFAFFLSGAAAAGSYYLYQGWIEERTVRGSVEAKYDQVQKDMLTVKAEKDQIRVEKDQVTAEKEKITAKSEEYRTKAEAMQAQLEKLQAEQSRIDSEKAELEKQLKSHQQMIVDLQTKMAELEKKAKEAQAACGVTPADLKSDPFSATAPAASTADAARSGASQLAFKPVTSGNPEASVSSAATAMPPAASEKPSNSETTAEVTPGSAQSSEVSATAAATTGPKILTVNRKFNFVVINQGLQEGLKMGDKLTVLKQGKEIATVQIEKLYDKFSAATLQAEDPKQQVAEGDEIRKA